MDKFKGVSTIVQINKKSTVASLALALVSIIFTACGSGGGSSSGGVDPNETAAKVNGKAITMEEVDRAVKQQSQGQESKLSPLELAGARLQVLETLIQQEVMFQKAEKEGTVPTEEEITAEINKQKTASGKSADQIDKDMKEQGMTEASLRDQVKKALATQKLVDKITGKIEAPKDSEIEAFYNGNKDAFVKKKGVKLGGIIVDPTNSGEGDQTTDQQTAVLKANEILGKIKTGQDFATLAREFSEDQSKFQSGDLGYLSEQDLTQAFDEQTAASLMNPQTQIGGILTSRSQGKLFILKLQDRSDKDEALTLDSPGVREQVQKSLVDSRKQLLAASYQAMAMNEAKVENFLAKKVVDNPNELSGARPAGASTPAAASTNVNTAANSNAAPSSNVNTAGNTNTAAKPATPATKPEATKPAPAPAKPASNTPANK
ncbi:MAG TPA: SurA N-terminal domain-containing protein [Pyrinomonadaceae bacterium]|nr:SurA N-terminal domain-containing protein [Pyrinomonadaceae bacterium]